MAKILNYTGKKDIIFRGDVVSYRGLTCLVSVHPESLFTVLTDLESGEIVAEYDTSFDADMDKDIKIICDRDNVVITLNK